MIERKPAQSERIEPLSIIMILVLAGISMAFLGLCASMLFTTYTAGIPAVPPPAVFYVTVALLMAATLLMRKARESYINSLYHRVSRFMWIAVALTTVFGIVQAIGWVQFFEGAQTIRSNQTVGFAFALSALHLAHVAGGVPFAVNFLLKMASAQKGKTSFPPIRVMRAISLYWDFIDVLWVALVALMAITALVA